MSRRLAPLNALRAFEAAARHLSFTKAAAELNVTPAAISHQVKSLEGYFGVALFRRLTRALLLTPAGQSVLPRLRDGFDMLAEACERLRSAESRRVLTVSVAPSLAARWLVTRLEGFRAAHPDIDIRLDANERLVDFARDDVDLAIRYGGGHYPGLHVEGLFRADAFPVCSPALLDGPKPLRRPADLARFRLLHVDWKTSGDTWPTWAMWLKAAGVQGVDTERGPRFTDAHLAVQTAIDGHGVVLASEVLVADDLAEGRLVRPFETSAASDFGYYIVCPPELAETEKCGAFAAWLRAEAAATLRDASSP